MHFPGWEGGLCLKPVNFLQTQASHFTDVGYRHPVIQASFVLGIRDLMSVRFLDFRGPQKRSFNLFIVLHNIHHGNELFPIFSGPMVMNLFPSDI